MEYGFAYSIYRQYYVWRHARTGARTFRMSEQDTKTKETFLRKVQKTLPESSATDLALISRAYDFAKSAHEGQMRASGTAYFEDHCLHVADHIIDLGPEGGDKGGYLIAEGTPEKVAKNPRSFTGLYLKPYLKKGK